MADSQFDWTDPLRLDQLLADEERMVRDQARRFCDEQLAPRVRDDFRHERFDRAGIRNVAIHKGLFSESDEKKFPRLREFAKVDDVGKAAKDWPQLNFLIYHAAYRYTGEGEPAMDAPSDDEPPLFDPGETVDDDN